MRRRGRRGRRIGVRVVMRLRRRIVVFVVLSAQPTSSVAVIGDVAAAGSYIKFDFLSLHGQCVQVVNGRGFGSRLTAEDAEACQGGD